MSRILRPYGIGPEAIRLKPGLVDKGYHAGDFNPSGNAIGSKIYECGAPSFALLAEG
jgi:hypothetical protein